MSRSTMTMTWALGLMVLVACAKSSSDTAQDAGGPMDGGGDASPASTDASNLEADVACIQGSQQSCMCDDGTVGFANCLSNGGFGACRGGPDGYGCRARCYLRQRQSCICDDGAVGYSNCLSDGNFGVCRCDP